MGQKPLKLHLSLHEQATRPLCNIQRPLGRHVPIYLADAQHSVQLLLAMSLYPVLSILQDMR